MNRTRNVILTGLLCGGLLLSHQQAAAKDSINGKESIALLLASEEELAVDAKNQQLLVALYIESGSEMTGRSSLKGQAALAEIAKYCQQELETYMGVQVYLVGTDQVLPVTDTAAPSRDKAALMQQAAAKGADVFVNLSLQTEVQAEASDGTGMAVISVAHGSEFGLLEEQYALPNQLSLKMIGKADAAMIAGKYQLPRGDWQESADERYFYENDKKVEGEKQINGNWYYFDPEQDGARYSGWRKQGDSRYYYLENGIQARGMHKVGDHYYYFDPADGTMYTGWYEEAGQQYYYDLSEGTLCFGQQEIDGDLYYFDDSKASMWTEVWIDGQYYGAEGAMEQPEMNQIAGRSLVNAQQLADYFRAAGYEYPEYYAGASDAPTLEDFCQIFCEEAWAEEIRIEVAFVQTMKETGWLTFQGDVSIEQFNFAGIGAIGGGEPGNSFADIRTGIRVQIQHLKAYASEEPLNNECVDPRFDYVPRGVAPYVEWLGIPDNPQGIGWAAAEDYGAAINSMMGDLLSH